MIEINAKNIFKLLKFIYNAKANHHEGFFHFIAFALAHPPPKS